MKTNERLAITLRAKIREVLDAVPAGRKIPAERIADDLRTIGYEVTHESPEFQEAREWNHKRNFIDFEYNHDFERDEWFLTEKGRSHA